MKKLATLCICFMVCATGQLVGMDKIIQHSNLYKKICLFKLENADLFKKLPDRLTEREKNLLIKFDQDVQNLQQLENQFKADAAKN